MGKDECFFDGLSIMGLIEALDNIVGVDGVAVGIPITSFSSPSSSLEPNISFSVFVSGYGVDFFFVAILLIMTVVMALNLRQKINFNHYIVFNGYLKK